MNIDVGDRVIIDAQTANIGVKTGTRGIVVMVDREAPPGAPDNMIILVDIGGKELWFSPIWVRPVSVVDLIGSMA